MKTNFAIALTMLGCCGAFGQGTILFQNVGPGLNAPFYGGDGVSKFSGDRYKAELLVGHGASSLTPVATTTFSSLPAAAGLFFGGVVALDGHAGGSSPFIQVRMWDSKSGVTYREAEFKGASAVFQLGARLGNPDAIPPTTPPPLYGLTSFSFPEPSTLVLAIFGGVALAVWRRLRINSERPDVYEN